MAKADLPEVETLIRSTGFYRNKALSLVTTSRMLVEKFGGQVPKTMDELLSLRGVARKTANVVLGVCYGIAEGVVVDTHVTRLSNRMGFTRETNPVKIEKDLVGIVPKDDWIWIAHAFITHGRGTCKAISPRCPDCILEALCPKRGV
jgi:endonuclease-3